MNSLQTLFTVMTVVRRHATTETPAAAAAAGASPELLAASRGALMELYQGGEIGGAGPRHSRGLPRGRGLPS